jgi:probable HAF family extracellular repeat protein
MMPQFEDSSQGSLTVDFSGPDDERPMLAMFTTIDGGRNWKLAATMPKEPSALVTTFAGSNWIAAAISDHKLSLKTVTSGGNISGLDAPGHNIDKDLIHLSRLSFASRSEGWALANGKLLSTRDAGSTWKGITPPNIRVPELSTPIEREQPSLDSYPEFQPRAAASAGGASEHLGFDKSLVILAPGMQKWWNESPYWVTNIYLPAALNRGTDGNLTKAWVSAMQKQGWGLIPTWFGRQPPCACANTACAPFSYTISSNTTTAIQQGANEADAAIKSAKALGLTPNIIYKDIEPYTSTPACSAAVIAFLNGWDSELKNVKGISAGVYGLPRAAQDDFSQVSPLPDDVWLTTFNQRVTIWGLGKLSGTLWADEQRINQYEQNVESSFGNSATYEIDPDIIGATIVSGSATSRSYNFTFASITSPRASYAQGINDINGGAGTLINESGQTGEIVGWYTDSAQNVHGFLLRVGGFSSIDYPGAIYTQAFAINDVEQIVGNYYDSSGFHGFLYQAGSFVPLDYPGASGTYATGINDAGQIVGYWIPNGGLHQHGFVYQGGAYRPLDDPAGLYTIPSGINGDGDIVGTSLPLDFVLGTGFVYQLGVFVQLPGVHNAYSAVNNNGQIAGTQETPYVGTDSPFLYQAGMLTFFDPGATQSIAYGMNDNAQIVGWNGDPVCDCGFVAVP